MVRRVQLKTTVKFVSCVMVMALTIPILTAGCSSENRESSDDSGSSGWYDVERVFFDDIAGGFGYPNSTAEGLVYTDGDTFILNYYQSVPDTDEDILCLKAYDFDGNLKMDLDADTAITEPKNVAGQFSYQIFVRGGDVCCLGRMTDWENNHDRFYLSVYDEDTNTFGDWTEIPGVGDKITISYWPISIFASDDKIEIYFGFSSFDGLSNLIKVTVDNDNNISSVDFADVLKDKGYYGIGSVLKCSDNEVVLVCYNDISYEVLIVNEDTMEGRPSSAITDPDRLMQCGDIICMSDNYSISKYDPETDAFSELVNFDNSNINRYEARRLRPVFYSEGEIVLFGCFDQSVDNHMKHEAIKLIPSDNDPRKGKTEIKLAVLGLDNWLEYKYAEAICIFNDTNPDAYITLDKRYLSDAPANDDYDYWISTQRVVDQMNEASELSNRVMVDLISGDGPDIILNGYEYSMLNNSRCLVDLSGYIDGPNGLDREKFFTNVLDGNTYQIPLSAQLYGVIYKSDATGFDLTAPTYEEYREFVSEGCNGCDPIGVGCNKLSYFLILFENIYPEISDDNGIPDLDNDEFRALAEYCRDLPEVATMDYCDVAGFNEFASGWGDFFFTGDSIMGLPSYSGIGHRLRIGDSVGISSGCTDIDSAWEFVKILLSDDVQSLTSTACSSVVRDVSRSAVDNAIATNNELADSYVSVDEWDLGPSRIDEGVTDLYINAMDAALPSSNLDPDIKVVLNEEIQAYFVGAKTLDEIIPLIEDRCSTIINERG